MTATEVPEAQRLRRENQNLRGVIRALIATSPTPDQTTKTALDAINGKRGRQ
ncbi:hypothetical protein [Kutzneria albida]|uniref:Uncharacterized protein n=1 Tax=Kutzneria albida DSM 43870 TaxID=1449976 RepID=W5WCJ1_9PSEU|nr:hypothetical protein [Kutzneria albida]AHH98251.1 hypothetical protein KALB_4889 [Kutzneria albida DSM 43870]